MLGLPEIDSATVGSCFHQVLQVVIALVQALTSGLTRRICISFKEICPGNRIEQEHIYISNLILLANR